MRRIGSLSPIKSDSELGAAPRRMFSESFRRAGWEEGVNLLHEKRYTEGEVGARIQATAHNGIVRADRSVIDNADSTLRLAGELNLKDESLALVATSRPKDLSPLSLRTPITVRGTLAQPRIGVEGGRRRQVGGGCGAGSGRRGLSRP